MKAEAIFMNRPALLLGVSSEDIIFLRADDYDNLLAEKDSYVEICEKHGMRLEIAEVDRNELELLKNNARQLQNKFAHLMRTPDGGVEVNGES